MPNVENINRLNNARSKAAFISDFFVAMSAAKEVFSFSNLGGQYGLFLFMQEIVEELKAIEENLKKEKANGKENN